MGETSISEKALSLVLLCVLCGDVAADFLHVYVADGLDELLKRCGRHCAGGLGEEDAVAEGEDRGDRLDLQRGSEALVGFGVELGKNDVFMLVRSLLKCRCESLARTAPIGPCVHDDGAIFLDDLGERVFRNINGAHY